MFTARKRVLAASTAVALMTLTACGSVGSTSDADKGGSAGGSGDGEYEIVLVPKVEGISWFQRMAEGVDQFDKDQDGVHARQIGPDTEDAAKQVSIIEDLMAQQVDAIVVVPNDPQAVAPVLKRARDAGIVVVTHEAPALAATDSVDLDLEAFSNEEFGQQMFEPLAKAMGGKGQLVGEVASLTSETHMAWYNAGVDFIKKNYPDIEIVANKPYEDNNSDETARRNAQEILSAYPNLKGFVGTSVSALANFSAILQEKNNTSVAASGLSLPSIAGPYLDAGFMTHAQAWDPAGAGYAGLSAALKLLKKEEVKDGTDLGYEGYEDVTVKDKIVSGHATLMIEKNQYPDGKFPF
jgi:simple sugar transport system substrate-binding protein